jgi:nucleoid DNA-binding protein
VNKSELVDAIASETGLSKADAAFKAGKALKEAVN